MQLRKVSWVVRVVWEAMVCAAIMVIVFFFLNFIFSSPAFAARLQHEDTYNRAWCTRMNGTAEVQLRDGTWADCVLENYVVEADFADKWYQSVGQSLHYAARLELPPAILLIVEKESHCRFVDRLRALLPSVALAIRGRWHRIRLFLVGPIFCEE